jgi:type II secretory pathway pseudopilin PulG
MTLVEVIVALVIIVLVGAATVGLFMAFSDYSVRSRDRAANNAAVEELIADFGTASSQKPLGSLPLGNYRMNDVRADTYTSGSSTYTVLDGWPQNPPV